jgi:rod shape-determining protein RodA
MIALSVFGILAISASEKADPDMQGFTQRQVIFALAGLTVFVVITAVPYRVFGRAAYPLFVLTLAMLVLVLKLPAQRESHRWIDLKVFLVQPSEIAKIAFVVMLAWYLRKGDRYRKLGGLAVPFILTVVPMALVLVEPDLGTAMLFLPTLFIMLFLAGAKLRHLFGVIGVAGVLVFLPVPHRLPATMRPAEAFDRESLAYWGSRKSAYLVSALPLAGMKHHQISRIVGWLRQDSEEIARGSGYQLRQSKMVLGAGCLTGQPTASRLQEYFRMLPEDHTDFIFSVIGGRWGLLGCLAILFFYGVIFLFGVEIATTTNDPFGRLLAVGVLAILFSQIAINVSMTMGLMPITGITLPLVSYGGSSLITNFIALALLINVGVRRPILLNRRPFEFGEKRQKPPQPYGPLADDWQ